MEPIELYDKFMSRMGHDINYTAIKKSNSDEVWSRIKFLISSPIMSDRIYMNSQDSDSETISDRIIDLISRDVIPSKYWNLIVFDTPSRFIIYSGYQRMIDDVSLLYNIQVEGWFIFGSTTERKHPYQVVSYQTARSNINDIDVVVITDSVVSDTKIHLYGYDIQTMTVDDFNSYSDGSHVLVAEVLHRRKMLNLQYPNYSYDDKNYNNFWFGSKLKVNENFDGETIRRTFSEKSSHSFVKAKKKLIDGDIVAGHKSYFHSIRLMHLASSICGEYGDYLTLKGFSCDRCEILAAFKHNTDDPTKIPDKMIQYYKDIKKIFKKQCVMQKGA